MKTHDIDENAKLDIARMQVLAGITKQQSANADGHDSPLTQSGTAKVEYMKKHKIRPGSDEWFKLWFARPGLTGENPMPLKS